MDDLFVKNLRLGDLGTQSILIRQGRIAAIGALPEPADTPVFDAGGRLALPAMVDGHIHLDKTLIGLPFIPHLPGETVAARIAAERQLRRDLDVPVRLRGGALLDRLATYGTVAVRSHIDIDTEIGLRHVEEVLALRETHGHLVDIQTVAFPQSGILRDKGTADLMAAALRAGVDLVGGLDPAGIDGDITGHLDTVFGLADKYGVGVDIHLHDPADLGAHELQQIALRTEALGLQGRVNVSHAFCLGALGDARLGEVADHLARAGVSIMTSAPGPVPMPPIKALRAAGVQVFAANDNIRDAWSPFGNGDLLERAGILCDRQDFRADADLALAYDLVSTVPSALLGRSGTGLAVGAPADFILLRAASIAEAVADRAGERVVIKAGRVVAVDGKLVGGQSPGNSGLPSLARKS
ncbi:hydrolase [Ketogulonicigenium robustum]|uniref:Hydrolase n=1 Tax=Ketogulonicigenium robustum TaxID=92947 RepID=A0A1W6NZZ6_9RHOB|nr:amidohydrolase family protein [Ketogulonicigenium robustum]ARO14731.1 hydrolase [Ketogulonicigenium robustum]